MSVSLWAYQPDKCDGNVCPGDCDSCGKADKEADKDDCVKRAAVIAILEERYRLRTHLHDMAAAQQLKLAKWEIDDLPSADVRHVVRGKWIKCNSGAGYKCSVCKARHSHADVLNGNHNFCYKCGAEMEKR